MKDWVKPYIKQYKGRMFFAILLGALGVASGAMLLFTSGYLISKSALQPENVMLVYVPIVAVRAFSIGQAAFPYAEKLVSHDLVLRILAHMRKRLYHIVEPQALFLRSRYQTGDLLGVLSDDIEHLQDLYLRSIIPSVIGVFIYAVFIIVIGIFDIPFALMMLFLLGVIVFLIPWLSFTMTRKNHLVIKKERQTLYGQLTDAIFGLTDWQASGRTTDLLKAQQQNDAKLLQTERHLQNWERMRNAMIQLVIGIAVILMLIWANKQAGLETITPTLIAAFTLMIMSITDALAPISDAVEHLPSYTDSVQRIKRVEHSHLPLDFPKDETWDHSQDATIVLNEVSYHYPNAQRNVIDSMSLTIPVGKKIAVLGKSGTGKSTLLKLLAGVLEPTHGKITVGGKPMHSGLLSQAVAVLNQKPHLFNTTIENNIRIGNPHASDAAIQNVVDQAQLTELIDSLPKGLQTSVEELGNRFSGGERQRIAFARVLLQNTPIILVDEATVGLDPQTERELLETVFKATTNKTVIWVTHHLAGAHMMDEILFLRHGKIYIQGSHTELLTTNDYYKKLYAMDLG
ncbi:MAG TPA: thiol reductant ABC exporter subunit CydC [Cerasibacillus sp.]|uniref:thiol reductant ABC exporter subunit CydC n=1 Tax=Cerasibacillus sp. TaxID=2498711 RepID=UPI002F401ACD